MHVDITLYVDKSKRQVKLMQNRNIFKKMDNKIVEWRYKPRDKPEASMI